MPSTKRPNSVFFSHSHFDQRKAYAISTWLYRAWPELSIFITHNALRELNALAPEYYFDKIVTTNVLLCLLSPASLRSPLVIAELNLATEHRCSVLLVADPWLSSYDDPTYVANLQRLGALQKSILDIRSVKARKALSSELSKSLGLSSRPELEFGLLDYIYRSDVPSFADATLPLPKGGHQIDPAEAHEDALRWLAVLEKWLQNQLLSVGIRPQRDFGTGSVEGRLLVLLSTSSEGTWPPMLTVLAPLLSLAFRSLLEDVVRRSSGDPLNAKLSRLLIHVTANEA